MISEVKRVKEQETYNADRMRRMVIAVLRILKVTNKAHISGIIVIDITAVDIPMNPASMMNELKSYKMGWQISVIRGSIDIPKMTVLKASMIFLRFVSSYMAVAYSLKTIR